MRPVLGIETSCDETATAIVAEDGEILAESVVSQSFEHAPFGGVVPEIAARTHLRYLPGQLRSTMAQAGVSFCDLAAIAATSGPGLIGGLIVGSQLGKGLAIGNQLPFLAINHLEAHALTARLPGLSGDRIVAFPYLLLLLSGGHSQCVVVRGAGHYMRLGGTVDDAVGEAFDKVAKLLDLGWPGGPELEKLAFDGDPARYPFPRPMLRRPGCDLSFSGLKTAVAQAVSRMSPTITDRQRMDIAASFQRAVVDVLADRAVHAIDMMRVEHPHSNVMVVAGGVASNAAVRTTLGAVASARGFHLVVPPIRLCSDNAVMVAWAGIERLRCGPECDIDVMARPRWPLGPTVR